jgi:hypothetical protein
MSFIFRLFLISLSFLSTALGDTNPKIKTFQLMPEEEFVNLLNSKKNNMTPFQMNLFHERANNIGNYNQTNNYINNKDVIKFERLNRINTFEKALNKNKIIGQSPLSDSPSYFSISPYDKSKTILIPFRITK